MVHCGPRDCTIWGSSWLPPFLLFRYCWRTYFKVLAVLFLASDSPAFLPSKKACRTDRFRHFWVRQQYPPVISTLRQTGIFWGGGAEIPDTSINVELVPPTRLIGQTIPHPTWYQWHKATERDHAPHTRHPHPLLPGIQALVGQIRTQKTDVA